MLILASKSKSRQDLLDAAGVEFKSVSAGIDEEAVKKEMRIAGQDSRKTSLQLATEKAMAVSKKYPRAFVIGADQILDLKGEWFSKPADLNAAHKHLKKLRNKTHLLVNGTAVVKNGSLVWFDNSVVKVTMRDFRIISWTIIWPKRGKTSAIPSGLIIWKIWALSWSNRTRGIIFQFSGCLCCLCWNVCAHAEN